MRRPPLRGSSQGQLHLARCHVPGSSRRAARKIVRGLREALAEGGRYAVADHVMSQHGGPWNLSEEARPKGGPTTS